MAIYPFKRLFVSDKPALIVRKPGLSPSPSGRRLSSSPPWFWFLSE
jgi:hypothetical protein